MGTYKEVKGDLLELFDKGEVEVIAHGCNTIATMGSGIARSIREKYPEAWFADLYNETSVGMWRLGKLSCNHDETIFNLYTQLMPGPCADLCAIRLSLRLMSTYLSKDTIIGLPLIGCGLGGLKFEHVKPIIKEELRDMNVIVVIYNK